MHLFSSQVLEERKLNDLTERNSLLNIDLLRIIKTEYKLAKLQRVSSDLT